MHSGWPGLKNMHREKLSMGQHRRALGNVHVGCSPGMASLNSREDPSRAGPPWAMTTGESVSDGKSELSDKKIGSSWAGMGMSVDGSVLDIVDFQTPLGRRDPYCSSIDSIQNHRPLRRKLLSHLYRGWRTNERR